MCCTNGINPQHLLSDGISTDYFVHAPFVLSIILQRVLALLTAAILSQSKAVCAARWQDTARLALSAPCLTEQ